MRPGEQLIHRIISKAALMISMPWQGLMAIRAPRLIQSAAKPPMLFVYMT